VQDRCIDEEPPLQLASPGHEYRCWYPVGTPEGIEALERNKREGLVATAALTQAETV
jgi:peptide/nickel transport system ATP-binding protein